MIVPHESISDEALQTLIESHVLQEGTDYGQHEWSLTEKCDQVRTWITAGKACIVYDPSTQSADIRLTEQIEESSLRFEPIDGQNMTDSQ